MFTERTSVGLDVHARSIQACAIDTKTGEFTKQRLTPDTREVIGWLSRLPGPIAVTYEAGPTGYWLCRDLTAAGLRCEVAAPSKLPRKPGDHVKNDTRDARMLAEALHADQVTSVQVPSVTREDARDLTRAHDDARVELMDARQRLNAFLLRRNLVYYGGSRWTGAHHRWIRTHAAQFTGPAAIAFEDYWHTVQTQTARKKRLATAITRLAADSEFTTITHRVACLRGISTLTAFALAVEIGDWHRFTGTTIAAFLGLTPSENSSGQRTSRGPITRAGNTHARRLLVEAAWHHTSHYRAGITLQRRWETMNDPIVVARAHAGNQRLAHRRATLTTRGLNPNVINTAIARELAGWCWSVATLPG